MELRRDLQSVHFPFKSCSVFQRMIHFRQHSAFVPRPSLICGTSRGKAFSHGRIAPGDRCVLFPTWAQSKWRTAPKTISRKFSGRPHVHGDGGIQKERHLLSAGVFFCNKTTPPLCGGPKPELSGPAIAGRSWKGGASKGFLSQIVRSKTVTRVITSRKRSEPTIYSNASSAVSKQHSVSGRFQT